MEYFKIDYGQKDKFNSIFHPIRWLIHHEKFDVANYFIDNFIGKVGKLRQEMPTTNSEQLYSCILKKYERKALQVEFCKVSVGEVEKLLLSINNDKPGIDNLDGRLLRMVADSLATPICHIFNLSLEESLCPQAVTQEW